MAEREITARLSLADLEEAWDQQAQPSDQKAVLSFGARTDLGKVRENNEDKFEFYFPSNPATLAAKGILLAVADGMGGHAAGQIASELALKTLINSYYSDNKPDVEGSLKVAVHEANSVVYNTASIPGRNGMGCTLTIAIIRGNQLFAAQVGDSRLYLKRGSSIRQVTEDHSWVNEQVRLGALTREEAEFSPYRNIITRALGQAPEVEPDFFNETLSVGDIVLLCSDGLTGVVSDDRICGVLNSSGPAEACKKLVECALDGGGPDNVTVAIARIESIEALEVAEGVQAEMFETPVPEPATDPEPEKKRGLFGFRK